MTWIAMQPYYKVHREIHYNEQRTVLQDREMYLYPEKLVTRYREFGIEEVLDLSYRRMGGEEGILYLHTIRGVYSYTVKADPADFIAIFKGLK